MEDKYTNPQNTDKFDVEEVEGELEMLQKVAPYPWKTSDTYTGNYIENNTGYKLLEPCGYAECYSVAFNFALKSPQRLAAAVKKIVELEEKVREREQDIKNSHKRLSYFYANNHPNCMQQVVGITENNERCNLMILKEFNSNGGVFLEVHLPSLKSSGEE